MTEAGRKHSPAFVLGPDEMHPTFSDMMNEVVRYGSGDARGSRGRACVRRRVSGFTDPH